MTKLSLTLALVLLLLCLGILLGEASALQVDVIKGSLPERPEEGEVVNFTLFVSDFSPYAHSISFDTDLRKYDDHPLYNLTNTVNKEVNEQHFVMPIKSSGTMSVHIIGEVPMVTEKKHCDGVTIILYDKTKGYTSCRIEELDEDGKPLIPSEEHTHTYTFDIKVPEIEEFQAKIHKINDDWLRKFLIDMHERGLIREANAISDWWLSRPGMVTLSWFIGSLVGVAFIFFVIGVRIGGRREEE